MHFKLIQIISSKIFRLLLVLVFIHKLGFSQDEQLPDNYKPLLEFQLFTGLDMYSQNFSESPVFDYNMERSLLIYKQQLPKNFSFCLAADSYEHKKDEALKRNVYVKRAYANYQYKNISVSAGLVVLSQFKLQRQIWTLRYLSKTFGNKYKYGENRGLGLIFNHKLNQQWAYDIALTNGKTTPDSKSKDDYTLMAGQTFQTNNLQVRFFNSLVCDSGNEHVHSFFISENLNRFKVGLELASDFNDKERDNCNFLGYSLFGTYQINEHIMLFSRFDTHDNISVSENLHYYMLTGMQYSCFQFLKASLYYQKEDAFNDCLGLSLFIYWNS